MLGLAVVASAARLRSLPPASCEDFCAELTHKVTVQEICSEFGGLCSGCSFCTVPTPATTTTTTATTQPSCSLQGMQATTSSGRPIAVLNRVPLGGEAPFTDRNYKFDTLGDFAGMNLYFVQPPNNDKNADPNQVMWTLAVPVPVTVYLDLWGGAAHQQKGLKVWLSTWQLTTMKGSAFGGRWGPGFVYKKTFNAGSIQIMGNGGGGHGVFYLFVQPACGSPALAAAQAVDYTFYFGTAVPSGKSGYLDLGQGYGKKGSLTYGWKCDGSSSVDYASGRRGPHRGNGMGLNHFDRSNTCRKGNQWLPVTWELQVPNGKYNVKVDFPESYKDKCMVQGQLACSNPSSPCQYRKEVIVSNGIFAVTGWSHDSRWCHSIARVNIVSA